MEFADFNLTDTQTLMTETTMPLIGLLWKHDEGDFLRSLKIPGLAGVKLVISDAHTGLKAAIARVFDATWQRCRVHFMRNALSYVPKVQHTIVAAAIGQAFNQADRDHAGETRRLVADQLRSHRMTDRRSFRSSVSRQNSRRTAR